MTKKRHVFDSSGGISTDAVLDIASRLESTFDPGGNLPEDCDAWASAHQNVIQELRGLCECALADDDEDYSPLAASPPAQAQEHIRERLLRILKCTNPPPCMYCMGEAKLILTSLTALPPAHGWQPMETAPKDGTTILLALNDYNIPSVDFGWHNGEYWRNYENAQLFPTCWMPLPDPPPAHGWHAEKEQP